jgi:hypothetical protein
VKIDPKQLICGFRPSLLKSLLQLGLFSTLSAMKVLSLDEPDATSTLMRLASEGWTEFREARDFVDWWDAGPLGQRLLATRLFKRISAAEGHRIVDALVREARLVNADPWSSRRIASIRLFGSMLTAAQDDEIADIDVVLEIRRRPLEEEHLERLERQEKRDMPGYMGVAAAALWPEQRIRRRLSRLSRRVRFHQAKDIERLGARYWTVYAFDLDAEREVGQDLVIRRPALVEQPEQGRAGKRDDAAVPAGKAWRGPRSWPITPDLAVTVSLAEEEGRLAQHLWQNGADLLLIARQLRKTRDEVQAYLAARRHVLRSGSMVVDGGFKRTVLRALPERRSYGAAVTLRMGTTLDSLVNIEFDDGAGRRIASLRWLRGQHVIDQAPAPLIPELEQVLKACTDWMVRMRSRTRGLDLTVSIHCAGDEIANGKVAPMVSLSPIMPPLIATLDELWPQPRRSYEGWHRAIEVTLSEPVQVVFIEGASRRTISGGQADAVVAAARQLLRDNMRALGDGAVWTAGVRGSLLTMGS